MADVEPGRWYRLEIVYRDGQKIVTVHAPQDGTTDVTPAIQAAFDAAADDE